MERFALTQFGPPRCSRQRAGGRVTGELLSRNLLHFRETQQHQTVHGEGINYPLPKLISPQRLFSPLPHQRLRLPVATRPWEQFSCAELRGLGRAVRRGTEAAPSACLGAQELRPGRGRGWEWSKACNSQSRRAEAGLGTGQRQALTPTLPCAVRSWGLHPMVALPAQRHVHCHIPMRMALGRETQFPRCYAAAGADGI